MVGVMAMAGFTNGFKNVRRFSIPCSAWFSWYGLFFAIGRIVQAVLIEMDVSQKDRGDIEC